MSYAGYNHHGEYDTRGGFDDESSPLFSYGRRPDVFDNSHLPHQQSPGTTNNTSIASAFDAYHRPLPHENRPRPISMNQADWCRALHPQQQQYPVDAFDDFLDSGAVDPELVRQQHMIQQQIALEQIQQQQWAANNGSGNNIDHQHARHSSSMSAIETKPYGTLVEMTATGSRNVSSAPSSLNVGLGKKESSFTSLPGSETDTSATTSGDHSVGGAEPNDGNGGGDDEDEDGLADALARIALAEERVAQGQCPSCGQQLYQVSGSGGGSSNKMPKWKKLLSPFGVGTATGSTNCTRNNKDGRAAPGDGATAASGGPKSADASTTTTRKKPLHIPGVVHRGQCVKCSTASNINTTTEVDENGANLFLQDDEFQEDQYLQNSILHPLTLHSNKSNSNNKTEAPTGGGCALATYTGPTDEHGHRHGQGILKWSNGDVYKGNFVHGVRQGPGTLTFANGSEYVGDWKANQMHGHGTRRFPNGDLYTGPYVHGQRCGTNGRFYFANGDLYVGHWKDDTMHGFGRYYYHHGQRYEGDFVNGQRHGKGKLQRLDGSVDIYRYQNNQRVGNGVRWSADRTTTWQLTPSNTTTRIVKTKIPMAQAVSLVYEIEGALQEQTAVAHTVDIPTTQVGTTV